MKQLSSDIETWINDLKHEYNWEIPKNWCHSQDELLITILLGIWIVRFLNESMEISDSSSFFFAIEKLNKEYSKAGAVWNFLQSLFNNLCDSTILDKILKQNIPDIRVTLYNDHFGNLLQHSMNKVDRKTLAANYTDFISADILIWFINSLNISTSSIVDPFCGSGRLLTAFLKSLKPVANFPRIRINDIMPSAVLLAYSRLLLIFSIRHQDFHLIEVSIGDAFSMLPSRSNPSFTPFDTYQTVLMNPPFTRTHRIKNLQKKSLMFLDTKFREYLHGQTGLHIYALILAYMLLESDGYLASVIPSATLLSSYSTGIQRLLLKDFRMNILASSDDQKACSEGSIFREVLLVAKKNQAKENHSVSFIRFLTHPNVEISSRYDVPLDQLFKEWNWTMFLRDPRMLEIRRHLFKTGMVQSGKILNLDIVRGVEMYGPNFFFIPNQAWKFVREKKGSVCIKSEKSEIIIPEQYLVRCLRKPGNYSQVISPTILDFALTIPNSYTNSEKWFMDYLAISERDAKPAKRKYGIKWLSHINQQLSTKKPCGHLFLIDKFGISTTSVMCHYTDLLHPCSKNFYVIRNLDPKQAKLQAAWINSSFFLMLFLCSRREIGGSYGRLQIIDYMKERLFLDFSLYPQSIKNEIINEFEKIRNLKLPPLPEQVQLGLKKPLDLAIAQGFNIFSKRPLELIDDIYTLINLAFKNLKRRDTKKLI